MTAARGKFRENAHFDGLDKVGCAVRHLFGTLDKLSLSNRVGCFGGGEAAGIAEGGGVFGNNSGSREDLGKYRDVKTCEMSLFYKNNKTFFI